MDPVIKQFLNSLRCPVCKGQIDLIDSKNLKQQFKVYNYGCAQNYDHYVINYFNAHGYRLEKEMLHIHDASHRYEVRKSYTVPGSKLIEVILSVFKTDAEGRVKDDVHLKSLSFKTDVIPFNGQGSEKMLNRIKTILLFQ